MASTPTYLPVYSLSTMETPTTSDYLVVQSAATNGDVGLLPISTLTSTFYQTYFDEVGVDDDVYALYTALSDWGTYTT